MWPASESRANEPVIEPGGDLHDEEADGERQRRRQPRLVARAGALRGSAVGVGVVVRHDAVHYRLRRA